MSRAWKNLAMVLCGAMLGGTGLAMADTDIRTGLWETTVSTTIEGMPFAPPPMTFNQCLTKEDLVPNTEPPDQNCDPVKYDISGNTASWSMRCQSEGVTTTGEGRIRYSGDTYQGEMNMSMSGGPMGEMKMKQTLSGRRLGPCQ